MGLLEGKVALVTGASRGVGAAIARCLAQEGAAVVANFLKSEGKAEDVARRIRQDGGKALPYRADVTDEAAVHEMVETARETLGPVDILVNHALPDYKFDPVARQNLASLRTEEVQ
jgi:3-oxoacyl-[acyl-carrier protein] reductase